MHWKRVQSARFPVGMVAMGIRWTCSWWQVIQVIWEVNKGPNCDQGFKCDLSNELCSPKWPTTHHLLTSANAKKKQSKKHHQKCSRKKSGGVFFWHIAHKLRRRGGVRLLLKFWARDVLRCQKWYPFSFSSSSSSLPCHRTRQKGQRAKPGSIRWIKGTKLTLDLWKYKWLFAPNSQNGLQWNIDPILS